MDQLAYIDNSIQQHVSQLQKEGLLDDQFQQLMQLQDESNPDFVAEVVNLYFEDSVGKIEKIGALLSSGAPNYYEIDQLVHQFKGSSASLGAQNIAYLCIKFRESCQQQNCSACQALLMQMRDAFTVLRQHLGFFLQLEQQRKALLRSLAQ